MDRLRHSTRPTVRMLFPTVLLAGGLLLSGPAHPMGSTAAAAAPLLLWQADSIQAYTASMESMEGFIDLHYDAATGRLLFEVGPEHFDRDFLYLTTLGTGLGSARAFNLDRGSANSQGVVRLRRAGPRVMLVRGNAEVTASGGEMAQARATESFPTSILAALPVLAEEGNRVLVDATNLLLSDVWGVSGSLRGYNLGSVQLDRDRSFVSVERTGSYPLNTEVRSVLTFAAESPSGELRRHTPDPRSMTLEQHHSFMRLPNEPMPERVYDPRTANGSTTLEDYGEGFDEDYRRRVVNRWRLVPSDPAAYLRGELVEPVTPIVYYLDPALPEPYRSAYREGTLWWNTALEAAGFRNALRVEDLPEGADPMDARYSVIQLTHRTDAGPSTGNGVSDPRTGEVIVAMPRMDSHRSLIDFNIYAGLLPAYDELGVEPQLDAEEFISARRRQHTAHEVGHTMGFPHNFIGGADNRSSVMDYPFPLISVDGRGAPDVSDAYRNSPGYSDSLAIRYAYTWYPDAAAERAGLEAMVQEALARGHRFITGSHAQLASSYPEATRWVEGRTMFEALARTQAVRSLMLEHFDERAIRPGEPMSWLNQRLAHVYLHHRYSVEGVVKYVGGMQFTYTLRGDGQVPTQVISPQEQRRAVAELVEVLSPEELAIPDEVSGMIPPTPSGYEEPDSWYDPAVGVELPPAVGAHATWIESPAGTALDPFAVARSFAQEVVDNLLHPQRMARVASFHTLDPDQLSLDELFTSLVDGTWGRTDPGNSSMAAYGRAAERAVLDGLFSLAMDDRSTSGTRDAAEQHLGRLAGRIGDMGTAGSPAEQAHRERALRDITRYLEDGIEPELRTGVFPMPLPWP